MSSERRNRFFWSVFLTLTILGVFLTRDRDTNFYYWKRITGGNEIGSSQLKINDDYFIHSYKEGGHIVYHRDYLDLPISFILKGKVNHADLERRELLVVVKQFDSCTIYNKVTDRSIFYVDYTLYADIGVVVVSDAVDEARMSIMCSALKGK